MQPVWLGGTTDEGEGIANVLTWTAPAAGTYTLSGSFVIGGTAPGASGASIAIVDSLGNIPLARTVVNQKTTNSFDVVRQLSAGDVLQFQVGSGFAPAAAVGLNGNITAIPEPGTWVAMAIFAGGAAYAGWRRRGLNRR
jgi:hypothetical protein